MLRPRLGEPGGVARRSAARRSAARLSAARPSVRRGATTGDAARLAASSAAAAGSPAAGSGRNRAWDPADSGAATATACFLVVRATRDPASLRDAGSHVVPRPNRGPRSGDGDATRSEDPHSAVTLAGGSEAPAEFRISEREPGRPVSPADCPGSRRPGARLKELDTGTGRFERTARAAGAACERGSGAALVDGREAFGAVSGAASDARATSASAASVAAASVGAGSVAAVSAAGASAPDPAPTAREASAAGASAAGASARPDPAAAADADASAPGRAAEAFAVPAAREGAALRFAPTLALFFPGGRHLGIRHRQSGNCRHQPGGTHAAPDAAPGRRRNHAWTSPVAAAGRAPARASAADRPAAADGPPRGAASAVAPR
jgi:hypothetical protein